MMAGTALENLIRYLGVDMIFNLRELTNGLAKLNFEDNFNSFQASVTIAASSELTIRNRLGEIPTGKLIIKTDNIDVVDGDTANTKDFVYLKNTSGSSANVTVVYFV